MIASQAGHKDVVELLIKSGADLGITSEVSICVLYRSVLLIKSRYKSELLDACTICFNYCTYFGYFSRMEIRL